MANVIDKLRETFRPRQRLTVEQYAAKLLAKGLHPDGSQILDPVPMAPPIGYKKTPSMVEIVRDMVRSEKLAQAARESGHETFEESEDFDIGDEPELMRSPWENQFDPPIEELLKAGREAMAAKEAQKEAQAAKKKAGGAGGRPPAKGAPEAAPEAPDEP